MPYRDRNQRLAMSRAHHAQYRPSPVPLPQEDSALPPYGAIVTSDDGSQIQCHVCGRWFRQLPMHTTRLHGLNAAAYKEQYGLARGASLLSPHTAELQRQASIARDQAGKGIPFGPDNRPPKRTGIENRLSTKIRYSEGKKGTYRRRPQEEPERERAVGDTEA
jgi:predicted transcriptional regulator